jgi:MSHA pilin protein MshA
MVKATQRGFTLIELVVVIVILGILSAFAVPRFMGLEAQAREASVRALEGSLRSASSLAHSVSIASGAAHNANITVEGDPIAMNFGYPTADAIAATLQDTSGFTATVASGVTTFARDGAANPATCRVTYTAPTAAGNAPVIVVPDPMNCQ